MSTVLTKKKHSGHDKSSSSDESIENLLYYKDCTHKQKTTESPPTPLRLEEPPKPACPCPRMCCSMCCECEGSQSFIGRQMAPLQMGGSMVSAPQAPFLRSETNPTNNHDPMNPPLYPITKQRQKKKRMKPSMLPPIGGRRNLGFTKEDIKNLISRDEDIKQILDDLVKVTMLKVHVKDVRDPVKPTEIANGDEDYID